MYRNLVLNFSGKVNQNLLNIKSGRYKDVVNCYHSEKVFGYKLKHKIKYEVPQEELLNRNKESNFYRLVTAYREHAHKIADINPVAFNIPNSIHSELDVKRYGLDDSQYVNFKGIIEVPKRQDGTVKEAVAFLQNVYANYISAEFMHAETEAEREWFANRLEKSSEETLDPETKVNIATEMIRSQAFDNFLAKKFTGLKRYGGEGAESMMAFFSELFRISANDGLEQIVLAMPHRGRLNLLTGMLKMPPAKLFRKLKGLPDFPEKFQATGDVISHLISSTDLTSEETHSTSSEKPLHVTMLYNPSHLEAVNPVSMGKTRAKQMLTKDGDYNSGENFKEFSSHILNVQVHGDGALIGQGINAECLALSGTPHFEIGGSVHLVVNNQVAFTTPGERGRSSRYCTDLAKIIGAPVIHVNGDHPEEVAKATRIAFEYQRKFRKDIFVDMNCYRQWGHNELDDPTLTNPALYNVIRARKTVPDLYTEKLVGEGLLSKTQIQHIVNTHSEWLNFELKAAEKYYPEDPCFQKQWEGYVQAPEAVTTWDTGVDKKLLTYIGIQSVTYPENFNIHPNLLKSHVQNRINKISYGSKIDWATAEAFAFGSLLHEGYNVRISGQDVGRGTFSHRHAMLVDQTTNYTHIPLNHLNPEQKAFLEVANSILSEEAVMGYEYGMSIESPKNLIIWEAQFGDFFNGAQSILDTFISSGETKWLWSSAMTILLPHGYDGAGPEHSSCRLERHLQLTDSKENKVDGDNVNIQVAQPSTPAQYFHLLRRQMVRPFRKPLIIVTPKTLLRLSACVSSFEDMEPGTSFLPVIGDTKVNPEEVQKVIIASGRHCYNLEDQRKQLDATNTAIIRLENLCPFPTLQLQEEIDKFPNAKYFVWSQEEPQNMGAWNFVKPRFENLIGKRLRYVGRPTLAAPAVGVGQWHQKQAEEVVQKPFQLKL